MKWIHERGYPMFTCDGCQEEFNKDSHEVYVFAKRDETIDLCDSCNAEFISDKEPKSILEEPLSDADWELLKHWVHVRQNETAKAEEANPNPTVQAQASRIRDLVSANVRLVRAIEGLLNAYCPGADWSNPGALQSDVRRAGEAICKTATGQPVSVVREADTGARVDDLSERLDALEVRLENLENECGENAGIQISGLKDDISRLETTVEQLERRIES